MFDKEYELFCEKADKNLIKTIYKMFSIYNLIKDKKITYYSHSMSKSMQTTDKYSIAIFLANLTVNDDITCFFKDKDITIKLVTDYLKISLEELEDVDKEEFRTLFSDSYKFLKCLSEPVSLADATPKLLMSNCLYDYYINSDVINSLFKENGRSIEKIRDDFAIYVGAPSMTDMIGTNCSFLPSKNNFDKLLEFGTYLSPCTSDIISRDREVRKLEASLISPGNAILIGEAGVGKTAIVEKLAYLIKNNKVPAVLKNKKIFSLDLTKVVASTRYRGELEEKLEKLVSVLEDNDDLIVFVDEIHMIMGAGSCNNDNIDVANFLKPYLSNGKIKMIGATTKEEYDRTILNDKAFRRRFNVVTVSEPDKETLSEILISKKDNYEKYLKIKLKNSDEMIGILTDLTSKEHRNYQDSISNPALAVNILGRAFAYAAIDEKKVITPFDFREAILEEETLYRGVRESYAKKLENIREKVKTKVIKFPKK